MGIGLMRAEESHTTLLGLKAFVQQHSSKAAHQGMRAAAQAEDASLVGRVMSEKPAGDGVPAAAAAAVAASDAGLTATGLHEERGMKAKLLGELDSMAANLKVCRSCVRNSCCVSSEDVNHCSSFGTGVLMLNSQQQLTAITGLYLWCHFVALARSCSLMHHFLQATLSGLEAWLSP